MGDHDLYIKGDGEKYFSVSSWVSHPKYNARTTDYDYSIITLKNPIDFSVSAMPICLPKNKLEGGEDAIVTGWGTTEYGAGKTPRYLQEARVTVLTARDCTAGDKLYTSSDITSRMLCAAEPGKDACQGDSGGPLIALEVKPSSPDEHQNMTIFQAGADQNKTEHYSVIGVTSWGIGCARPDAPGVYSK